MKPKRKLAGDRRPRRFVRQQREVAQHFGVTPPAVTEWLRRGMPEQTRRGYDLEAIAAWRAEMAKAKAAAAAALDDAVAGGKELKALAAEYRRLKNELLRLELKGMRRETVTREEMRRGCEERDAFFLSVMLNLARHVAPVCFGLTAQEIEAVIDREARGVLLSISQGLPLPWERGRGEEADQERAEESIEPETEAGPVVADDRRAAEPDLMAISE